MKQFIRATLATALVAAAININAADTSLVGEVDFGKLTPSSSKSEFVEVHIKGNLISMVARLAEKEEPEIAQMIRAVKLIRVNVFGIDDDNRAETEKRITAIRSDLDSKGWERLVMVQDKGDDVGVYVKTRGDEAIEGIVVTVISGKKEAVLVNIVGDLNPNKIVAIGERFNIEPIKKLREQLPKEASAK